MDVHLSFGSTSTPSRSVSRPSSSSSKDNFDVDSLESTPPKRLHTTFLLPK